MTGEYIKFEDMYKVLYDLGGCDATEEWCKGYDKAIDLAIEELMHLERYPQEEPETTADDMFKKAGYRIEKDTGMIWYRNDHKEICFYLGNKIVTVIDRSRHYDVDDAAWFTYNETQAIIKKMQELGFEE